MWWKSEKYRGGAGGGERRRGRPRADPAAGELVRVTVSLPADLVERARRVGGGNLSLGLRKLYVGD